MPIGATDCGRSYPERLPHAGGKQRHDFPLTLSEEKVEMCRYSLENVASFRATQGDKFVVAVSNYGSVFVGDKPAETPGFPVGGKALACVIGGQKLTLENVTFCQPAKLIGHRYDPVARKFDGAFGMAEYVGKEVVVEVVNHRDFESEAKHPEQADALIFPCGKLILMHNLAPGTTGIVGEKPTLEKKLGLDTMNALDPEPKPDDEKPEQPADEPAKKPEPAQA